MHYFIKRSDKVNGPFTDAQIKSGLKSKKLKGNDLISTSKDGPWKSLAEARGRETDNLANGATVSADDVAAWIGDEALGTNENSVSTDNNTISSEHVADGLGDSDKQYQLENDSRFSTASSTAYTNPTHGSEVEPPTTKKCPFCAEPIAIQAIKCKHCGELLGTTSNGGVRNPIKHQQQSNRSSFLLYGIGFAVIATVAVISIFLLTRHNATDPKESFEAMIYGLEDRIKPLFTSASGATLKATSYNIEKTDSLVSPYTAKVFVNCYMLADDGSGTWDFGYMFSYAFQDNRWVHKTSSSSPGDSSYDFLIENVSDSSERLMLLTKKADLIGKITLFARKNMIDVQKAIDDGASRKP